MRGNALTRSEVTELNRYGVWLARLSKSLNFMMSVIGNLPLTESEAGKFTVQERTKMLRLALEDLKVERENVSNAIDSLQSEYNALREEFMTSRY
jgi:hypothetical protein